MSSPTQAAEQAAQAIYNWVRLSSPEQIEQEGRKYILIRLLNMLTEADLAEQGDIEQCAQSVQTLEKRVQTLTEQIKKLEKELGI